MLFLVDGYNLLKSIFRKSFISKNEIDWFMINISRYARKKNHEMIIVFDGFNADHYNYKYDNHVYVIYSQNVTADEYIKNYIKNNKLNNSAVIVSSDLDITKFAAKFDIPSIDSLLFFDKVQNNIEKESKTKSLNIKIQNSSGQLYKFNQDNKDDEVNKELDELMQMGSSYIMHKDQDQNFNNGKWPDNERLRTTSSKKEKKINKILKKI